MSLIAHHGCSYFIKNTVKTVNREILLVPLLCFFR